MMAYLTGKKNESHKLTRENVKLTSFLGKRSKQNHNNSFIMKSPSACKA
jgi:hypothetical protein